MKYFTLALVVLGLYACPRDPPVTVPERIDWSVVTASGPYVEPKGPTANQEVFKRERRRAYAALQFERSAAPRDMK